MTSHFCRFSLAWLVLACCTTVTLAHQGPDPVAHWTFKRASIVDGVCRARLGPDLRLADSVRVVNDAYGQSLDLTDDRQVAGVSDAAPSDADSTPAEVLTVAAWVLIDEAESTGGIVSAYQDDQGKPQLAWSLGYDEHVPTFRLRTADGQVQVLRGSTKYQKGQWVHVAGVFDGSLAELYVNGQLDAELQLTDGVSWNPAGTQYALGGLLDAEATPLRGRLKEASVYDMAAKAQWVQHAFSHMVKLTTIEPDARADALAMMVEPYLQYGTQDGMTVMWQTTLPGSSIVHYGETADCPQQVEGDAAEIHEVRITGLEPETLYFYCVESKDDGGQTVTSDVSTFSTAVLPGTPFAFAVISDTQMHPVVAGKLSKLAWAQRPSFLLHPGDLVDTGVNDSHWTQHFFPGMHELISRVPMYPVLGNHEQNARNYYEYMSLPSPEYYYEFPYGDAQFFMIDSNRNVGPGSEQYEWLDEQLGKSQAKWKFVCHHHPPYSSDENDYGDLWKTNKSSRGDLRARQLSTLYDKHKVDIVWNGHIHSYERTWPVKDGQAADDQEGSIYMIVGGGGGNLETPGPYRPFFQNQVRRGHHYVMVHINGQTLELRSYDLDDRLFDTVQIKKPAATP
ncbi:metallophosphoesterase [Aeoliella sp. ICT_H6.2]|uniref:Metallophosphoesterase n=1 Tax=Aeoliella straminimaris TaxID=2954799 RepID=A0A9X2F634_9BACT|nr:LamG-like jellyroll fold domain-containing protein [Aeoliella straminimaris]MCO6042393.1 metallophosphoesterase [Aeoliella straminimaris]